MIRPRRRGSGFTLLEVMVALAILAIALAAVFSAEAGSVRMAARARKMGWATLLVRCKMGEIEEQIMSEGFPALNDEGSDDCCKDAQIDGYTCKWQIEPVVMPDTMFEEDGEKAGEKGEKGEKDPKDGKGDAKDLAALEGKTDLKDTLDKDKDDKSKDKDGKNKKLSPSEILKDPKKLLAGSATGSSSSMGILDSEASEGAGGGADMDAIAAMAMGYVYPILKPSFESQIRRATVTVTWKEGGSEHSFDVTQYMVAEQPIVMPTGDPNAQTTTPLTGAGALTGSGNATGTGKSTSSGAGK